MGDWDLAFDADEFELDLLEVDELVASARAEDPSSGSEQWTRAPVQPDGAAAAAAANDDNPSASGRARTRRACDRCRRARGRCDGNEPCASCAARGLTCTYLSKWGRADRESIKRSAATAALDDDDDNDPRAPACERKRPKGLDPPVDKHTPSDLCALPARHALSVTATATRSLELVTVAAELVNVYEENMLQLRLPTDRLRARLVCGDVLPVDLQFELSAIVVTAAAALGQTSLVTDALDRARVLAASNVGLRSVHTAQGHMLLFQFFLGRDRARATIHQSLAMSAVASASGHSGASHPLGALGTATSELTAHGGPHAPDARLSSSATFTCTTTKRHLFGLGSRETAITDESTSSGLPRPIAVLPAGGSGGQVALPPASASACAEFACVAPMSSGGAPAPIADTLVAAMAVRALKTTPKLDDCRRASPWLTSLAAWVQCVDLRRCRSTDAPYALQIELVAPLMCELNTFLIFIALFTVLPVGHPLAAAERAVIHATQNYMEPFTAFASVDRTAWRAEHDILIAFIERLTDEMDADWRQWDGRGRAPLYGVRGVEFDILFARFIIAKVAVLHGEQSGMGRWVAASRALLEQVLLQPTLAREANHYLFVPLAAICTLVAYLGGEVELGAIGLAMVDGLVVSRPCAETVVSALMELMALALVNPSQTLP